MSLLDKVNMDLLGPLLIVFGFLRFKKYYSVPLKILKGIRFFISNTTLSQKHLRAPASTSNKNLSIIDKKLEEFNLSMMEMDGTIRKGSIFQGLLLYDVYETIVYLSVCSAAMHIFSVSFHCFSPTSAYSIWGTIFVALSAILPFRCLIRILLMTGFEAFESRVAVIVALISLVVSAAFLFSSIDILKLDNVLASTSVHCNALLLQISSTAIQPSLPVMTAAVKGVISLLVMLTALGMTIPALRFSQSFNTLLFGAKHEKGSLSAQLLLIMDHFLPVLVAVIMIPQGFGLNSLSPRADGHFLAAQLAVTALMVAVRLYCLRKHIQSFLDATVKMISVEIAEGNRTEAMTAGIQVSTTCPYPVETLSATH
jgi:Predicted transmembrane protein 161AB